MNSNSRLLLILLPLTLATGQDCDSLIVPVILRYVSNRKLPAFTLEEAVSVALADNRLCSTHAHVFLEQLLCHRGSDFITEDDPIEQQGARIKELCRIIRRHDDIQLTLPRARLYKPTSNDSSKRKRQSALERMLQDNLVDTPSRKYFKVYQADDLDFEPCGGLSRVHQLKIDAFLASSTGTFTRKVIALQLLPLLHATKRLWPRFDLVVEYCGSRIEH
jgi:hypothetical protein